MAQTYKEWEADALTDTTIQVFLDMCSLILDWNHTERGDMWYVHTLQMLASILMLF